ncbi:MAG: extracellular solute-binding protein [Treponema sp.]|nr:extracellular solute-binding protein [Treponema sp.]
MKLMHRILLAVLLLSIASLPLFASGQGGTAPAAVNNKLTVWMPINSNVAANFTNEGDTFFAKELSRQTGIDVTYQHPAAGAENEAFNLMVADGTYPDIIEWNFATGYAGGPEKAISDGVIVRLNDIIDKWSPNLKKVFADNPDYAKQSRTDTGSYYDYPFVRDGQLLLFSFGLYMRMDWLKDLGLPNPQTMDDVHNVLVAFRDQKGATSPYTGESGILLGDNAFCYAFGQNYGFYVHNDGTVHYGVLEPGFRTYLTTMAQWYKEGLIDQDIFSNNFASVTSKLLDGKSGMSNGWLSSGMNARNLAAKPTNPSFSLMMVANPSTTKGQKSDYSYGDFAVPPTACGTISGTTKNQQLAAQFLDYGYSDAGHMLFNFGIEGVSYNMVNGYPTYTTAAIGNPNGWTPSQGVAAYARASFGGSFLQDERYIRQLMNTPEASSSLDTIINMPALNHNLPPLTPTPNESQEMASIMNEVNTYVSEMVTKYILGTENLGTFDTFISTVQRMGIDRALAIQNAALDRYNKR